MKEKAIQKLEKTQKNIVFGSFLHGAGRSFLANYFSEELEKAGIEVKRISSGDVFKELARNSEKSIEDFIQEITEEKRKAKQIDVKIDQKVKQKINEEKNKILVIDSLLAPFYTEGVKILVKTDAETAGERVFKGKRKADEEYDSAEEAAKELKKRTERDRQRYKELSEDNEVPKEWREVYRKAFMNWGSKEEFDVTVDNSGTKQESMEQLYKGISEVLQ